MNVNPFSYLIEKLKSKVSKSGDTMTGQLIINANTQVPISISNENANGPCYMGFRNQNGTLGYYLVGTDYKPHFESRNGVDTQIALTSDLGGVSHEIKKSNASGVLTYQLSLNTIHVMEFSNATYHVLVSGGFAYHSDKKIGGDTLTLSYDEGTGILTVSGARAITNAHIAKWSIG